MEIKSQDHGTWRRIRVVDFETLFTEDPKQGDPEKPYQYKLDKNIKEKFQKWKEVFAAMLVDIVYDTDGNVDDCEKVISSSNSYRKGQDIVSEYIQDRIMPFTNGCLSKGQINGDFIEWVNLNYGAGNKKNITVKDIAQAMNKKYGKEKNGVWVNVRFSPLSLSRNMVNSGEDGGDDDEETTTDDDFDLQEL